MITLEPGPSILELEANGTPGQGIVILQTPAEPDGSRRVIAAWREDPTRQPEEIAREWARRLPVGARISICITARRWTIFTVLAGFEVHQGPRRALGPGGA